MGVLNKREKGRPIQNDQWKVYQNWLRSVIGKTNNNKTNQNKGKQNRIKQNNQANKQTKSIERSNKWKKE